MTTKTGRVGPPVGSRGVRTMEAARAGLPRRRERTTDRPREREHTWTLRDCEVATTNEEQVAVLLGREARTNEVGRANDRERRGLMATKGSEALARGHAGPHPDGKE